MSREDVKVLVREMGGFIRGSISGKTHYLVVGSKIEDGRDTCEGCKHATAQFINEKNNKSIH